MQIEILFEQLLILAILAGVGVIAAKAGVMSSEGKDLLSRVIYNITLPLMLFTNFSALDFDMRLLENTLLTMVLAFFSMVLSFLIGWLAAKAFKIKGTEGDVFTTQMIFGNIVFLGYPLVFSLYGEEGLLYASGFQLISNILLYTLGVILLTKGNGKTIGKSMMHVINPNTIAIVAGFIVFLLPFKIPLFLQKSLGGLGGTTVYLSMIYIGAMMYHSKIRGLIFRKSIYILSSIKLLVVPLLLALIFILAGTFADGGLNTLVLSVVVLQSAMPAMTIVIILARIYGSDDKMATANVFVSTLLSVVTIPIVLFVIERYL